jgi:hypothetical protein
MSKYDKEINEVINHSFPSLKGHRIIVFENNKIYGARGIYLYFFSVFVFGRKTSKRGVSKGGLAHELSHIEMFKKWGFWKSAFLSFLQFFSTRIRRKIEAGADRMAIQKGYGKELYIARRRTLTDSNERIKKMVDKYYLSLDEIKRLSKS